MRDADTVEVLSRVKGALRIADNALRDARRAIAQLHDELNAQPQEAQHEHNQPDPLRAA